MTCIAAVVKDGIGYIAGDRAASDGEVMVPIADPKIWKSGEYLFGYYGSFAGERLAYNFSPSPVGDNDLVTFMNSTFLEELLEAYETCHITRENEFGLVVVVQGNIFIHNTDGFSMTRCALPYLAEGSGGEIAMGSLWTTMQAEIDPAKCLELAVKAAIEFSPHCIGPVDILSSEEK